MLVAVVLAAVAAVVCAVGWLQARKGWRVAREGWTLARQHAGRVQKQLELELELTKRLHDELEHEKRERELERGNVRKLVPAFSTAKPSDNSAGFARMALRAWMLWHNDCPVVLPFRQLLAAELEPEARVLLACELYARAVMESALAAHFDGENPRSDRFVLEQLANALGDDFAGRVAADVALRGVTFSLAASEPARPTSEASAQVAAPQPPEV